MNRAAHWIALLPVMLCFGVSELTAYIGYALVQWAESFDEKENIE